MTNAILRISSPTFALLTLLFLLAPSTAQAEPKLPYSSWPGNEPFRAPPERQPIVPESPLPAERAVARHAAELGLAAGFLHKLCPATVDRCDNSLGLSLSARGSSRPTPHFSWGAALDHGSFGESLTLGTTRLVLDDTTTSLALFGRVMPFSHGSFDPHLELAAGGGRFAERGSVDFGAGPLPIEEVTMAPLLRVALGLDFHLSTSVRLGARFDWTHWLLSRYERCAEVAFGACTLPSPGHLDPANALWNWQLGATFLFGGRH